MDIDTVAEAVSETLEALAFMEATPAGDETDVSDESKLLWSKLDLNSPLNGVMAVSMPEQLLKQIVDTVYGVPDSAPEGEEAMLKDTRLSDTLGEIVNTLAGNVLKRVVPSEQAFTISLPETGESAVDISGMDAFMFKVSGCLVGVYVQVDE